MNKNFTIVVSIVGICIILVLCISIYSFNKFISDNNNRLSEMENLIKELQINQSYNSNVYREEKTSAIYNQGKGTIEKQDAINDKDSKSGLDTNPTKP